MSQRVGPYTILFSASGSTKKSVGKFSIKCMVFELGASKHKKRLQKCEFKHSMEKLNIVDRNRFDETYIKRCALQNYTTYVKRIKNNEQNFAKSPKNLKKRVF
jgi:hypothetical protein